MTIAIDMPKEEFMREMEKRDSEGVPSIFESLCLGRPLQDIIESARSGVIRESVDEAFDSFQRDVEKFKYPDVEDILPLWRPDPNESIDAGNYIYCKFGFRGFNLGKTDGIAIILSKEQITQCKAMGYSDGPNTKVFECRADKELEPEINYYFNYKSGKLMTEREVEKYVGSKA